MSESTKPSRLDLKREEKLDIDWEDGHHSSFSIEFLRGMCPCAQCKLVRTGTDPHNISPAPKKKPLLTILPGNYAEPIKVLSAELVGNYAIKLEWSDGHGSGIYSFEYLRTLSEGKDSTAEAQRTQR